MAENQQGGAGFHVTFTNESKCTLSLAKEVKRKINWAFLGAGSGLQLVVFRDILGELRRSYMVLGIEPGLTEYKVSALLTISLAPWTIFRLWKDTYNTEYFLLYHTFKILFS